MQNISDQNIKEIVLTGLNIDYGKFGTETRTYVFGMVQELDKSGRNRKIANLHLLSQI
jgi:hypothetical protein